MKKYFNIFLKIVVSISLFYFLFSNIDANSLFINFQLLDKRYLPLIFLLIILNYIVSSIRWKQLLLNKNTSNVSVKYLTSLYFIGSFFNNFMPTSIGGDAFKIYALGKRIKDNTLAFTSTFMERFTGVIVLVLISYFGLVKTLDFWLTQLPDVIKYNSFLTIIFEILLFGGFWMFSFIAFLSLNYLSKKVSFLKKIYDSFLIYKEERKVLLVAFFSSALVQLFSIFTQYLIFLALGVDITIWNAFFIFPITTLAGFFIPSLNGLGVQDALYVQFLGVLGFSKELALSASVIYHLARLFVSLFGGVLYALGKDK